MNAPTIEAAAAGKRYVKFADTPTLVGRAMQLRSRTKRSQLWAVRDVTFTAQPGECLGIIGRNGSGKSTMLRMLAGVTAPTTGSVTVRGRVAPLIAVGVGFHPELTGRENVYLSSAILGRDRAETDAVFDEIVDFADIGEFLDTPVKFYSSGMFVRLGFAVAISIRPEVLLVDEVLAVGDIGFQQRCFRRIEEMQDAGTTIVLVSHNLTAVSRLCDRTLVLHDAEPRFLGDTSEAISRYHELLAGDVGGGPGGPVTPRHVRVTDLDGAPTNSLERMQRFRVEIELECHEPVVDPVIGIQVFSSTGILAFGRTSSWEHRRSYRPGDRIRCTVEATAALAPGTFEIQVGALDHDDRRLLPPTPVASVFVAGAQRTRGIADLDATFSFPD